MADLIALRGGLCLPERVLQLAWSLDNRGHRLGDNGGKLTVSEGSRLTADDRAQIAAARLHLLALVHYEAPGVEA